MGSIFLVRHGQTTHNRNRLIQGPRIDAELSDLGRLQALHVAKAFSVTPLGALYSSPLVRARQTATTVAEHHEDDRMAVQVVPELYEMDYGQLAGRSYTEVKPEMEQVMAAWRMGFTDQSFPGGESPVLAQHRIRPFAARVVEQARHEDVLVVGHGRLNRILLATLTGAGLQRLEEFPQANASISEVAVVDGLVHVKRLNDTSHLADVADLGSSVGA